LSLTVYTMLHITNMLKSLSDIQTDTYGWWWIVSKGKSKSLKNSLKITHKFQYNYHQSVSIQLSPKCIIWIKSMLAFVLSYFKIPPSIVRLDSGQT